MKKIFVLGIDALSPGLIERWAEAGHLPNFRRILTEGCFGRLRSPGEFSSPQAWPSFLTGVNPGVHGIFSFVQHVPHTYTTENVTARNIRVPTIFELLSRAGARVASLNVPFTFPLTELNGVGIADWLCPSLASPGATWPRQLAADLQRRYGTYPFHADIKRHVRAGHYDRAVRNCLEGIRIKAEVGLDLYRQGPWDLFVLAFVETDAVQHYFWHFSDPAHPLYAQADRARWGEPILQVYQALDVFLGDLLAALDDDTLLLIMSDHGGAIGSRGRNYMPGLLEHLGLLAKKRAAAKALRPLRNRARALTEAVHGFLPHAFKMRLYNGRLTGPLIERFFARSLTADNDWTRTRAYSYYWETAPWVNLAGREPLGIVQPGAEYEQVRQIILDALSSATDEATGQPAVERAFRREEVYSGPDLEHVPDIGIWWNRRIPLYGPLRVETVPGLVHQQEMDVGMLPGGHDPLGTIAAWGNGQLSAAALEGARIEDLAPTILTLLDQPVPAHIEGRSLAAPSASRPASQTSPPALPKSGPPLGSPESPPPPVATPYSQAEEEIVTERLRNLGYM